MRLFCPFIPFVCLSDLPTYSILASQSTPSSPVIDLGYVRYQGSLDSSTNISSFLGVRYAAPPTGDLRFRAPQPPANDTSGQVLAATTQPNVCIQSVLGASPDNELGSVTATSIAGLYTGGVTPGTSEDCLFLNVYTPALSTSNASLPVIVWTHGGGFELGGASTYDGSQLIKWSENGAGVVVVVLQYRLGLFGFLSGDAVKQDGVLNAGLLDQEFALQWVQQYISKFGGDPTRVTLWGQSAGADSVIQHLIAYGGDDTPSLFRAGIMSSSFLPSQYPYDDAIPEGLFSSVAELANCTSGSDSTMSCLRSTQVATLEAIGNVINAADFTGSSAFVPVVDGEFIMQRPIEALAQGNVRKVPILAITNADEGLIFMNETQADEMSISQYASRLFPKLSPKQVNEVAETYRNVGDTHFKTVTAIQSEAIYVCPTYYLLDSFEGLVYKGEFAIPPATHLSDMQYYYTGINLGPEFPLPHLFNNTEFITSFSQSFLNFVEHLSPHAMPSQEDNITPSWSPWSLGAQTEMLFNETQSTGTGSSGDYVPEIKVTETDAALLARCAFWKGMGEEMGQ